MKKITLIIFCAFTAVIIFFSLFGGAIRQSLYVSVTTAQVELSMLENTPGVFRVVPNGAIQTEDNGVAYVWILSEADDIGEKYYYAEKTSVEITARDDIYTGIRGLTDGTVVIVASESALENKTRVKISGKYGD